MCQYRICCLWTKGAISKLYFIVYYIFFVSSNFLLSFDSRPENRFSLWNVMLKFFVISSGNGSSYLYLIQRIYWKSAPSIYWFCHFPSSSSCFVFVLFFSFTKAYTFIKAKKSSIYRFNVRNSNWYQKNSCILNHVSRPITKANSVKYNEMENEKRPSRKK